jgi:hypothetical protein
MLDVKKTNAEAQRAQRFLCRSGFSPTMCYESTTAVGLKPDLQVIVQFWCDSNDVTPNGWNPLLFIMARVLLLQSSLVNNGSANSNLCVFA